MAPLLLLTAALAAQARFDVGAEGWSGTAWREGHLTITNLDNRNDPPPGSLTIERAVGTLAGAPGFSAPNVLGFGGYAPGDGAAFGRFGSVDIVPDAIADAGRLDAFCFQGTSMELRLEAWRGGAVVGADQATLPGNYAMGHVRLEVRGVAFDRLRLVADPAGGDVAFLSIDDVLVGSPGDTGAPAADTDVVDTDAVDTDPADAEDTSDPRGEVGEGDDTDPAARDTDAPPDAPDDTDPAARDTDPPVDSDPAPAGDNATDRPGDEAKDAAGCGCATGGRGPAWLAAALFAVSRRRPRAR